MNKAQETNSVRVKIFDREYVLRTDGDPDRLHALCAVLDERMRNITAETGVVDTYKVAVLAALSFADDARRAKEEMIKLDDAVARRSAACVSMLARILHGNS
jgi:cell division protein ZapA (FtsZ GTPase activity inhibitor)